MTHVLTVDDIATYLDAQGMRLMAVMVRQQMESLRECRASNARTLEAYYAIKEKYEPGKHYVHPGYRSPPESDG